MRCFYCQKKSKLSIYISLILIFVHIPTFALAAENPELLDEIKNILWNYYVTPPPQEILKQKTIDDVLKTLNDPYTKYYTEKEFKDFWLSLEGKFAGIGLTIEKSDGKVTVTKVIPNTPATRVNIQKGDILTHVNNIPLDNLSMDEITQLFRGKPGTFLRLKTYRTSTSTFLTYLLTREYIKIDPIESTILTKNIGYIKIIDFNQEAAEEFVDHLNNLKKQGIKGLIVDLRDNPGGLIGSALDISRELVPPGLFVKLLYRGESPKLISTVGTFHKLPLIVLVNENTASAAEILAGAIQDRNAGIVVGTTTYGKASVQSLIPLVNGGALKFTSGRYLTPIGRSIDKIGLKPDFYIANPQQQIMGAIWMLDNQIHKNLTFQLNNYNVLINGTIHKAGTKPFLYKGNFMVPLRSTVENLGGRVEFISPNNIKIFLGEDTIKLSLDSHLVIYNGYRQAYLPIKPLLKEQPTVVPIRPFAELLGAKVEWRSKTRQVIVSY